MNKAKLPAEHSSTDGIKTFHRFPRPSSDVSDIFQLSLYSAFSAPLREIISAVPQGGRQGIWSELHLRNGLLFFGGFEILSFFYAGEAAEKSAEKCSPIGVQRAN